MTLSWSNESWDFENYLAETDDQNEIQAVYTNEPQSYGNLISQNRKGGAIWTPSYYQYDALGSTRALTDGDGDATDTYVYDAWGNEVSVNGSTVNPFRWVGRVGYYWDDAEGTFYIRARVYEPVTGRWMSQDPLVFPDPRQAGRFLRSGEIGGLFGSVNSYTYSGRPQNMIDPLGLYPGSEGHGSTISPTNSYTLIADYQQAIDASFDQTVAGLPFHARQIASYCRNAFRIVVIAATIGTGNNNKFVYTCKYGWIDHGHFFNNAAIAYIAGVPTAWLLSEINEKLQGLVHSDSTYTPEDLISNKLGRDMAATTRSADLQVIALHEAGGVHEQLPRASFYSIKLYWYYLLKNSGAVRWNSRTTPWLDRDLDDFRENPRNDITSIELSREYYESTETWKCLCDGDKPKKAEDQF